MAGNWVATTGGAPLASLGVVCSNDSPGNVPTIAQRTPIQPTTTLGTITQPVNGQGGWLRGLELSASLPLDMVSSSLAGFGVQANLSLTNSSITVRDAGYPDQALPLPGLSRNVLNLTAYYESDGFSVRASRRSRGNFLASVGGVDAGSCVEFAATTNGSRNMQFKCTGPLAQQSMAWRNVDCQKCCVASCAKHGRSKNQRA